MSGALAQLKSRVDEARSGWTDKTGKNCKYQSLTSVSKSHKNLFSRVPLQRMTYIFQLKQYKNGEGKTFLCEDVDSAAS